MWKDVDAETKNIFLNNKHNNTQKARVKNLRQIMGTTNQITFCADTVAKRNDHNTIEVDSTWKKKRM